MPERGRASYRKVRREGAADRLCLERTESVSVIPVRATRSFDCARVHPLRENKTFRLAPLRMTDWKSKDSTNISKTEAVCAASTPSQAHLLLRPKTILRVVIDHPDRLHESIANRRTDKAEPPFL